jgi:LmbE family N-acetylglucosaminyl deacetylase
MATLVFFHAHPDDEVMPTGGSIAKAADDGHRVVLVVATNGDHGEVPHDLAPGETVLERRRAELARSAAILGIHRIEYLGYTDSGMTGWAHNDHEESFWQADVEEAAGRLAGILREEQADVLVAYDWHGTYGHPDHIQVHRVGTRAAALAETPRLFESTWNRDAMSDLAEDFAEANDADWDVNGPADDGNPFGEPASAIHLAVDVSEYVERKRAAIACHASQATDVGAFLALPREVFDLAFSTEWFIRPGSPEGLHHGWLLDDPA